MAKKLPITQFDLITLPQSTQMFKAIIPYMDFNLQKNLSMIIRINELEQTMYFYNSPQGRNVFKSCSSNTSFGSINSFYDIFSNPEIVNSILVYCPEKYTSLINNFRAFSAMSDLFNSVNDAESNRDNFQQGSFEPGFSNIPFSNKSSSKEPFSFVNNFMSPKQQELYNNYLKELDKLEKQEENMHKPDSDS